MNIKKIRTTNLKAFSHIKVNASHQKTFIPAKNTPPNKQVKKYFRRARKGNISIIIPAKNEAAKIHRVILACKKLEPGIEVLVIANGCKDSTAKIARAAGAKVIEIKEELGHDVGRAIGAIHAKGSILLFVDADMVIEPELLRPFIQKIRTGFDIALNLYPRNHVIFPPHPTVTAKHTLNIILGRQDLKAASMTAIPFAMKKKAAKMIGYENLAIPPLAQAIAIDKGLKVGIGGFVNVGQLNPIRTRRTNKHARNPIRDLIIGDHLEAIAYIIDKKGSRGGFGDLGRKRDKLEEPFELSNLLQKLVTPIDQIVSDQTVQQVATIIPACNEAKSIASAIKKAQKAGTDTILVVDNGSRDETAKIAERSGANVLAYTERLGHDVGRALGAKSLTEEAHMIFTDGDITLPSKSIKRFVDSVQNGTDVALNNLNNIIPKLRQFDKVSVLKRFLNIAIDRPELGICSLTAVPHGLSYHAIQTIGAENLAIPPLAYVIAIQKNLDIQPVHGVDVVKRNKIRPKLHRSTKRPLEKLIIGDHIEALSYLQSKLGARGPFPDYIRKRDLLERYVKNS